jgi:hypothetical protein
MLFSIFYRARRLGPKTVVILSINTSLVHMHACIAASEIGRMGGLFALNSCCKVYVISESNVATLVTLRITVIKSTSARAVNASKIMLQSSGPAAVTPN